MSSAARNLAKKTR